MKTKLSFLVLPLRSKGLVLALCLGVVLTTLALVACGDNSSPTGSGSGGSSSSYTAPPDRESQGVKIDGFDVTNYGKKVVISGIVKASDPNLITKVTYSGVDISWIKRSDGQTGSISVNHAKTFDLSADIDLKNEAIKCDVKYTITVEARTSQDSVTVKSDTFEKDPALCASQNSSGSGEVSSSSVAVWKFGSPSTGEILANTPVAIGSGSATFELVGENEIVKQPDLRISGGTVRFPEKFGADFISPDSSYTTEKLGSEPAVHSSLSDIDPEMGVSGPDYYLVYLGEKGSDGIYLLQFTKRENATFSSWPLKYTYWPAVEHP